MSYPASTPPQFPAWLHVLASLSLGVAALCAGFIIIDIVRRPQRMWIMNLVWPLTALFGGVIWLAGYLRWGRADGRGERRGEGEDRAPRPSTPMAIAVAKGASHCGAGCALADLIGEWLGFFFPPVAIWFGWHSLFRDKVFADWLLDFAVAFLLGVGFQYFTIKPMRQLSVAQGLWQAVKADTASIAAWQVGMYGVMGLIQFVWFRPAFGASAPVDGVEFWFAMQLAMLGGFVTAYPVNWLLVSSGVKERM